MVDVDLNKVTVEAVPDNNETKEEEHVAIAEKDNEEEPVPDVEASDKEKDEPLDDHSENKENPPDAAAASGEDSERKPSETSSHLEESMSAVIDLLENNTKRLNLTWKLMVITNMISVNGVDSKLVEEIAAVENVAYVEEAGAVKTSGKEPKIWKKLKSVWKSKKWKNWASKHLHFLIDDDSKNKFSIVIQVNESFHFYRENSTILDGKFSATNFNIF